MLRKALPNGTSCTKNITKKREPSVAKSKKKPVAKTAKKPVVKAKRAKKSTPKAAKPAKKAAAKTAKPTKKAKSPAKSSKMVSAKPSAKTVAKPSTKAPAKAPAKKAAPEVKVTKALPFATAKPNKKMDFSGFVTPLDDRVMIQVAEAAKKTAGGLYIPDTVTSMTGNLEGLVVSVGRGRLDKKGKVHPLDLKVGDKVMFPEYSASKIKIQDQDLMILRESDVLGVVG
ncbi:MAG: co-chaperone GroES [Bdellovibrionaceae bacterium]|nr:co-chaperone GroES [Pseudobdellovibrionaceae bacterium]